MSWIETTVRILTAFFVLFMITRVLGKKQLGQLTFFNYVAGIAIGSLAANFTLNTNVPIAQGIYSLIAWGLLTLLLGYIALKSSNARVIIDGQPSILIKHGEISKRALGENRLNIDDLNMMLRKAKVFNIKEVDYAILEPNGQVSVLKKPEYQNVTRQDMYIPVQVNSLPAQIISDGRVVDKNLKEFGIDRLWLDNEISKQGYEDINQIFYAELSTDGGLYIVPVQNDKYGLIH